MHCVQEFAAELSEDYMAASNPVYVTRAVLGIATLLITLAVGGLSGVDVLRLWHGPPAGGQMQGSGFCTSGLCCQSNEACMSLSIHGCGRGRVVPDE